MNTFRSDRLEEKSPSPQPSPGKGEGKRDRHVALLLAMTDEEAEGEGKRKSRGEKKGGYKGALPPYSLLKLKAIKFRISIKREISALAYKILTL